MNGVSPRRGVPTRIGRCALFQRSVAPEAAITVMALGLPVKSSAFRRCGRTRSGSVVKGEVIPCANAVVPTVQAAAAPRPPALDEGAQRETPFRSCVGVNR